jgi:hypothetical protein
MRWALYPALLLVFATACTRSGVFRDGVYVDDAVRYRVGRLPGGWNRVSQTGGQIAFIERETTATILAHAVCGVLDAPLSVLTHHLLIDFTEKRFLSRKTIPFANREALRSHVLAKLDGVPVEIDSVVLKKNGCVFDFTYSAPPAHFAARHADFEGFLQGFEKLPNAGEEK